MKSKFSPAQREIFTVYLKLLRKLKRPPTREDMSRSGINRDRVRSSFTSLNNLRRIARERHPNYFSGILDESLFTPKAFKQLRSVVKGYRRFVITTAVSGCKLDSAFFASIKGYCKRNKAYLLVLPVADPAHNLDNNQTMLLDPKIKTQHIVFDDLALNSNIFISSIKLSAKHVDPITGLARIGQRNGSFIFGSPKQRLHYVPVSANAKYPHALMTTGAITKPNYKTKRYMSERSAYIATADHVMGAVIVELEDGNFFHFRQIQSDRVGGFYDLGRYYDGDTVTPSKAAAVVMGDWHSGETDPTARKAWQELCDTVRPDYLMVHDGFNGLFGNPHEQGRVITQAQRADVLGLADELRGYAEDLDELQGWATKGVVSVHSNHDEFLLRWLQDGRFNKEPHNTRIGLQLAGVAIDGHNPLRAGVEQCGLKHKSRVKWLEPGEDFIVAGVQLGVHGHKGANGAKGTLPSIEHAHGQSVSGHDHTPGILRGAWRVGTSSYLRLDYNKDGASSWLHAACVVYKNGARQLINSFGGKWRLK